MTQDTKDRPPEKVQDDEEMLLDIDSSMRRSAYVLSSGLPSREYADFDGYYLGGEGDYDFNQELAQIRLLKFVNSIVPRIVSECTKHSIARLAFGEKRDDGPVGMLTNMNLILYHSRREGCIVRPDRRLFAASIKGRPVIPGERIMIVSDVATSGNTILRPARRLRELGAVVPAAFALLDRSENAREQLAQEGIELIAYCTLGDRDKIRDRYIQGPVH